MTKLNISTSKHPNTYVLIDNDDYEYLNQWKWTRSQRYAVRRDYKTGKIVTMHRVIMNTPKDMDTDHINNNPLDNRKCNLRICTTSQNLQNQRPQKRKTSSLFKGVSYDKHRSKWRAYIKHNSVNIHLGRFKTEIEAAKAYNEKALEIFGEYAYLNEV